VTYIEETFHIGVSDEDLVPENFYTLERIDAFVCERRRAL
jgi:acyl carrier protein